MLSPSAHLAEYLIVILALAGVGAWHLLLEFVGASLAGLATGASLPFPRSAVGKEAVPSSVVFVTLLNFRGDFDGGKIDDFFFFGGGGNHFGLVFVRCRKWLPGFRCRASGSVPKILKDDYFLHKFHSLILRTRRDFLKYIFFPGAGI